MHDRTPLGPAKSQRVSGRVIGVVGQQISLVHSGGLAAVQGDLDIAGRVLQRGVEHRCQDLVVESVFREHD
jgi:hypothetical protein